MRKMLAGLTVEIYHLLETNIHHSNVELVVGIMFEKAEDLAELYNKPGAAAKKTKEYPELCTEYLNRARIIMKEVEETMWQKQKSPMHAPTYTGRAGNIHYDIKG